MARAEALATQTRAPSHGRVVRTLKDGYWDRTEVVEMPDGSRRVRKSSKGSAPPGPWGVGALRQEIAYFSLLSEAARLVFPPVLAAWDDPSEGTSAVGYEVPFYAEHVDAGELARSQALEQAEVDSFQDALVAALLGRVHVPFASGDQPLSIHVESVVLHALDLLGSVPELAGLIGAQAVQINQQHLAGPRAAFARVVEQAETLAALDGEPQVLLHGDCFLENILWRRSSLPAEGDAPQLLLIDPVSVAGVLRGPPLFDLLKYVSYATGELPALRSEWLSVTGFEGESAGYHYGIRSDAPELAPYRARDWHSRVRRAFETRYGPTNERMYHLIDGYFSAAMAVNTTGLQRRARLLKATLEFNRALAA